MTSFYGCSMKKWNSVGLTSKTKAKILTKTILLSKFADLLLFKSKVLSVKSFHKYKSF